MTISEFNTITGELEKYYEKDLNDEQRRVWYDEFKNKNASEYQRILNLSRRECKYMPKLADLIEIQRNMSHTEVKPQKNEFNEVHCDKCKNTGLIPYTRTVNDIKTQYYALCSCENVKKIPQGLQKRMYSAVELGI